MRSAPRFDSTLGSDEESSRNREDETTGVKERKKGEPLSELEDGVEKVRGYPAGTSKSYHRECTLLFTTNEISVRIGK